MDLPVWQELYSSLGRSDFEIISVAQDSQGEQAAAKWFDDASPAFHCVVDETHKISSLFGWVNVPSAAWIDEEGRIVRTNEGAYAGEHRIDAGLFSIDFGSTAFADATRDWVERGAASELVWSSDQVRAHLKPISEDTALADPTFKLGLHFQVSGDSEKGQRYFAEAQRLSPDNWNYHRQGWTHKGTGYAMRQWFRKTKTLRQRKGRYYDPMGLPGEPEARVTTVDFIWTKLGRKMRGLFGGRSPS